MSKQINSETTGPRRLDLELDGRIGTSSGETGSVALRASEAEARSRLLAAGPPSITDHNLSQWLDSSCGIRVSLETYRTYPSDGGFQVHVTGAHPSGDRNNCEKALQGVMTKTVGPTKQQAKEWIAIIETTTIPRRRDEASTAIALEIYADAVMKYPADIGKYVCEEWSKTEKFFPALAELNEKMDVAYDRRRWTLSALKDWML